jgi:hypothetical protein
MAATRNLRRLVVGCLTVAAGLASCKGKEPPPSRETGAPPAAAPTTTLPPALPPTTTTTLPPPVWRSVRWGMTKPEVIAAFPGEAQQLASPAAFAQGTASSDVTIPAHDLEGVKFRVLFGFEAQGLNRIHLSAGKADDATCGFIEKALTEKHGEPAQRESTGTSLRGQQMTWKLSDQTVVLACAGKPGLGFQSVTVDYLTPGAGLPVATR